MIINDCYDYLIHLVFCAVSGQTPEKKPEGFTYEDVLNAGIEHDVANIAYLGLMRGEEKPEKEVLLRWEQRYLLGIRRNAEQMSERDRIAAALHEAGIATLEVQGTVVKGFYPSEDLRNMSDIDFIIRHEDLEKAEKVIAGLDFELGKGYGRDVNAKSKKANVEIHTEFFAQESEVFKIMHDPFSYVTEENALDARVSRDSFWLFHILHTLKHYLGSGTGIRRILDIYFVRRALENDVNWQMTKKTLAENGFEKPYEDLISLSEMWFSGKEADRDISEIAETVKYSGTHGKRELRVRRELEKMKSEGKHFVKLRFFLRRVFPPKEQIYLMHPYCREHNLPWAFSVVYRAYKVIMSSQRRKLIGMYVKDLKKTDAGGIDKN